MDISYSSGRKVNRLDVVKIIDAVGEVVTQHTPMLEKISGEVLGHALVRWAPRLPRLQTLELYDGGPLEDELVHAMIHDHCPQFNSLSIFTWTTEERDHKFAKFISSVRPQSLKMVETIRDIGAGAETFLALNNHSESLKDLRLCVSKDTSQHLSLLRGCTTLEALQVEVSDGIVNLETTQNDVFLEVIDWLRKCENLRRLSFKLGSAAAIVAPVLLENKIKLRRLNIDSYVLKDSRVFHRSLVHQKASLSALSLMGDTDEMGYDDIEILVDSLRQLTELRTLQLLVQEVFRDDHIISIISNLTKLEDLCISGLEINDEVLESIGDLKNLRAVTFSRFTTNGLLDLIERLGPGNQGIRIMVEMAEPDTLLTDEEVAYVRESLATKVGGTLEYTQDPNISEFEGDSD